jgi:ElaB/YqjD/DUF883 family membrane-anchored ribosome-binding protein
MTPAQRLIAAEAEADRARENVSATLSLLQERLQPRELAREAARNVRDGAAAKAEDGIEAAKRHPGTVLGILGAVGLIAARKRIMARMRGDRGSETSA